MVTKGKGSRGFTLIELMVATLVVALLLMVAIPSYQSLRQEQLVRAATQAIYTDVMLLKSEAIKRGGPLTLKLFNAGQPNWCYRIAIDGTCDSCSDNCSSIEGRKGADADEFRGVMLDSNFAKSGVETALQFNNRRGNFKSLYGVPHNGSICLKNGNSEYAVIIAPVGRIRTDVVTGGSPCP
ncbi:GspH/FimT family pseudopilin [Aeromonas sobria]|uniref:GspH/FimT family pseudopilin n=1 Tax=Aeromonas sobria TaxID=646 RepID=UPI003D057A76